MEKATTSLNPDEKTMLLNLEIDTGICAVVDYFEIFMDRMLLCRRAAEYFGVQFRFVINGTVLI